MMQWSVRTLLLLSTYLTGDCSVHAIAESQNGLRPLRVVTFNLLHDGAGSGFLDGDTHLEERLEMTIRELKTLDPDIIAVQEASESRRHGNVPERLAKALGLHVVFEPATEHVFGVWPLDSIVVGMMGFKEGSAILSRFPIAASHVYDLPRCKKWLEPRILLQAELPRCGDRCKCFPHTQAAATNARWNGSARSSALVLAAVPRCSWETSTHRKPLRFS